jgi:hypothetical protein
MNISCGRCNASTLIHLGQVDHHTDDTLPLLLNDGKNDWLSETVFSACYGGMGIVL